MPALRFILFSTLFSLIPLSALSANQHSNIYQQWLNQRESIEALVILPELFPWDNANTTAAETITAPSIKINLTSRQLTLYEGSKDIARYAVAIGQRRHKTPIGPRSLNKLILNPWWYPPDSEWAKDATDTPPGPYNPLGKVKFPLGGKILLHGTNKPWSVGRTASHGCMRMKHSHVIALADWLLEKHADIRDEKLLKLHREHWMRRSHEVKLHQEIPVEIVYQRVELENDELIIYPDVYGFRPEITHEVIDALALVGVPSHEADLSKLPSRFPKRENVHIKLRDLVKGLGSPDNMTQLASQ